MNNNMCQLKADEALEFVAKAIKFGYRVQLVKCRHRQWFIKWWPREEKKQA